MLRLQDLKFPSLAQTEPKFFNSYIGPSLGQDGHYTGSYETSDHN